MMNKYIKFLDDFRLMPKIWLTLYGVITYNVVNWFMELPDPSAVQQAFTGIIIGGGLLGVFTFYKSSKSKDDSCE